MKIFLILSSLSMVACANVFADALDDSLNDFEIQDFQNFRGKSARSKGPEIIDLDFLDDLDALQKDPILQASPSLNADANANQEIHANFGNDDKLKEAKDAQDESLDAWKSAIDKYQRLEIKVKKRVGRRNTLRAVISKVLGDKLQKALNSKSIVHVPWKRMAKGDILNWPENVSFAEIPSLKMKELEVLVDNFDKMEFSADFLSRVKSMRLSGKPRTILSQHD